MNQHSIFSVIPRHNIPPMPDMNMHSVFEYQTLRGILDEMSDAVVIIDADGNTEYLNDSASRLTGIVPNMAFGRSLGEIFTLLDINTMTPIEDPMTWLRINFTKKLAPNFIQIQKQDRSKIMADISITPLRLVNDVLTGMMLVIRDISNYSVNLNQLIEAAHHDENSQLLHRSVLEHRLKHVVQSNTSTDQHALLFIDLNHFKEINDTAGNLIGDQVLCEIAELFRSQLRERDTLARIGSDEFGLLLEHCPLPWAIERAQAIMRSATQNIFMIDGKNFILDISIGIAAFHSGEHNINDVLRIADAACYTAKRNKTEGTKICSSVMD